MQTNYTDKEVFKARPYQKIAGKFILDNPKCGLLMDMGLGKTAVSLFALQILKNMCFKVATPLIIGPKRVIESVWLQEAERWQGIDLKGVKIAGNEKQRIAAISSEADYYLVSVDNIAWLVKYFNTTWPYDMVIVDESSKFKSSKSQRFRALKRVITKVDRVVILTGTPAPNGLLDLWPQLYLLDGGQRLEPLVTHFRDKYFNHNAYSHKYELRQGADSIITDKIKDICVSMSAKDYLKDLPDLVVNDVKLSFDEKLRADYEEFKREQVLLLKDKEITALNKAALGIKLLQFANGAIYDENKKWHNVHDIKLDALEEIIEEANGNNILCAYNYQHDLEKILKKFKGYARQLKTDKDVVDWNKGKIPLLVMHPASGGHGLNLQFGGHIAVWYGLNYNLEYYLQFNKRILRPGQNHVVILHRLLMLETLDMRVASVLAGKDSVQNDLINAVRLIIDEVLYK